MQIAIGQQPWQPWLGSRFKLQGVASGRWEQWGFSPGLSLTLGWRGRAHYQKANDRYSQPLPSSSPSIYGQPKPNRSLQTDFRFPVSLDPAQMTAIGALADWRLAAFAIVIGKGKSWVASRFSLSHRCCGRRERSCQYLLNGFRRRSQKAISKATALALPTVTLPNPTRKLMPGNRRPAPQSRHVHEQIGPSEGSSAVHFGTQYRHSRLRR